MRPALCVVRPKTETPDARRQTLDARRQTLGAGSTYGFDVYRWRCLWVDLSDGHLFSRIE